MRIIPLLDKITPVIPDVTTRRLFEDIGNFSFCVWRTREDGTIERIPPLEFLAPK